MEWTPEGGVRPSTIGTMDAGVRSAAAQRFAVDPRSMRSSNHWKSNPTVSSSADALRMLGVLAGKSVFFLGAYVALDWLSYVHAVLPLGITPWNPTAGLVLAVLITFRWRTLPLAVLAPVLADYVVRGGPGAPWTLVTGGLVIGLGYSAAAVVLRRIGFHSDIAAARDTDRRRRWVAAVHRFRGRRCPHGAGQGRLYLWQPPTVELGGVTGIRGQHCRASEPASCVNQPLIALFVSANAPMTTIPASTRATCSRGRT